MNDFFGMNQKTVALLSFLSFLPIAVAGWMISGILGVKLAFGLTVIFGMTAGVIVFYIAMVQRAEQPALASDTSGKRH